MPGHDDTEGRFTSITEEEISLLLNDKDSENMKRATKASVSVLELYLHEKGQPTDFLFLPMSPLNDLLKIFYIKAPRKNQEPYTRSSLRAICFGLRYHIKLSQLDVDIIKGQEFEEANRVFKAKTVQLKRLLVL